MDDTLIKVEDLCKIYNPGENEVWALDHVSRIRQVDIYEYARLSGCADIR